MEQELKELREQVKELMEWKRVREIQQIAYPLDDASRTTLGGVTLNGIGSATLTQIINTSGASASVPAAYAGSIIIAAEGGQYTVPYL